MKQNIKIRIVLVLLFSVIFLLKISDYYDLLSGFIVFILLAFDLFERNHTNVKEHELIYYFSWILIGLITTTVRRCNIVPYTPIFLVSIMKLILIIGYLFRYKSFKVTRTLLSKITLIVIALYIIELIVNSTHGFSSITLLWTKVSTVELILLLIINKNRIDFKISILEFLWKK
ncbi:hypothetical protein [Winogradskyella sp.]|jgi:hypothetical protein|uniref:hypothetical protein n=1 Tax=Winogradskyella sp. TaxID=1883156 RepID=UPI0025D84ABB|nr:hypothetical protein [Winogradskyella sp.]MCT4629669.1 hypothetical protein [Winogradskyella sp.]